MKKNKIKTLSFILIMVLLLGIVSVSGMSVSEIDPDNKYKYEEMVIPKALPVDDGESLIGKFYNTVRAMSTIVVKMPLQMMKQLLIM